MQKEENKKRNPYNLPTTREEITHWVLEQKSNDDDFVSRLLSEHINQIETNDECMIFYHEIDGWFEFISEEFPDLIKRKESNDPVHGNGEIVFVAGVRIGLIDKTNSIYPSGII